MNAGLLDNPSQPLICVDSSGNETGKIIDRKSAHTFPGEKHLAIQILVFNRRNELVLHERPLKKVGGGVLDAPTTHILAGETPEQAARRCLRDEYGIDGGIAVKVLGGYSYEKDYGDGSCENEFCLAAYAVHNGTISPNSDHAPKLVNVPAKKVLADLKTESGKYPVWLKETVAIVAKNSEAKKFFS